MNKEREERDLEIFGQQLLNNKGVQLCSVLEEKYNSRNYE